VTVGLDASGDDLPGKHILSLFLPKLDRAVLAAQPIRRARDRGDGLLSLRGVAARLNVSERAVRYWLEARLLAPVEGCRGRRFWFNLDPATMRRLEAAAARATSRIPRRSSTRKEKAL
jgi:hypothetical protein